jgi:hypothetical protein
MINIRLRSSSRSLPAHQALAFAKAELVSAAADIASQVRKPSELQLAERTWRDRMRRGSELSDEIRDLVAQRKKPDDSALNRKITELNAERENLRLGEALRAVLDARGPYIAAVAAALAPSRRTAAWRAIAVLAELRAALETLDDAQRELVRAGATVSRLPASHLVRSALAALEQRLRADA